MTVNDLMKRLKNIDGDKMVLFRESVGWENINLKEERFNVYIEYDKSPIFSNE